MHAGEPALPPLAQPADGVPEDATLSVGSMLGRTSVGEPAKPLSPPRKKAIDLGGGAMFVGETSAGKPHGRGELILPNGSVHSGSFRDGRAHGDGVLYDSSGSVMTGSWMDNRRVGAFRTIDPKGGEWADMHDESGKRISRKKRAPPPDGAQGARPCSHCGVRFHAMFNSSCRQHSGKWMRCDESESLDREEFPEGGMWLCCGSKTRRGGAGCTVGQHATGAIDGPMESDGQAGREVRLCRDANGEVVISTGARARVARPPPESLDPGWRAAARETLLSAADAFVCDRGEVWLDAARHASLAPLASLAECGKSGCACTRTTYPTVRQRFRDEVVSRALAAQLPGRAIHYVSVGSGKLLSDLDVLCALQRAGCVIASAAFIDVAYGGETCAPALSELEAYLSPECTPLFFASSAAYAHARVHAGLSRAHVLVQIDADEIPSHELMQLSTVALHPQGFALRLANERHPNRLPIHAWRRAEVLSLSDAREPPEPTDPLEVALERVREELPTANADVVYAALLKTLDANSLLLFETKPIAR